MGEEKKFEENLVAADLETTGLDEKKNTVLEVALARLNEKYEVVGSTYHAVLKIPKRGAQYSGDPDLTVAVMHSQNGLWLECIGESAKPREQVDAELVQWCHEHGFSKRSIYLQGRTVSFDHRFLKEHFPRFGEYLSHRVDDTGSVQRFLRRAGVYLPPHDEGHSPHRAMPDLEYAVRQLQHCNGVLKNLLVRAGE